MGKKEDLKPDPTPLVREARKILKRMEITKRISDEAYQGGQIDTFKMYKSMYDAAYIKLISIREELVLIGGRESLTRVGLRVPKGLFVRSENNE